MLTTILITLSLAVIATYVGVMIHRERIPSSISATYYSLKHRLWFGTTMWLTAGMLMPAILESTPCSYQFTAFLACAGMMMVGVAPNFREGLDRKVHNAGAVMCLTFSQVWVALACPLVLLVWLAYLAYTAWAMKKQWNGNFKETLMATNPLLWVEVSALLTTYLTLFIVWKNI